MKHKIIILVGQSACGKSAIYKQLVKKGYKGLITNTTRPMREGEVDGKDYNFLSKDGTLVWDKPIKQGKGRITSPFGLRKQPLANGAGSTTHEGIDIAADLNTPVYAPANGTITTSTLEVYNGNCIRMDNGVINGKNVTSVYAHLAARVVKPGQTVSKGDLIGYVGSTGKTPDGRSTSSGPHLHFGIKENGQPVNPIKYIGNY